MVGNAGFVCYFEHRVLMGGEEEINFFIRSPCFLNMWEAFWSKPAFHIGRLCNVSVSSGFQPNFLS